MVAGNEGGAHSFALLGWGATVIDDKMQMLSQIIVACPLMELLSLVCPHEPIQFVLGVQLLPFFHNAPAPTRRGKLEV